jgi:glycosyltransferase involved in cell wall biosynthesis
MGRPKTSSTRERGLPVPTLSVVMPVHNALPHLDAAIESILGQTWRDFEFVILDDASTDASKERLEHWAAKDERIRLLAVDENLGPVGSSNAVASAARTEVVARMDADDISYPTRLERQLELLRSDRRLALVASMADVMDSSGRQVRKAELWRLGRRSAFVPFPHGAIMYRREAFERIGGYREECVFWEDQDLIVRMLEAGEIGVIPEALYSVRQSSTSTRIVSNRDRLEHAVDLMYRCTAALERGESYEDLLKAPSVGDEKVNPRVFLSLGSVILWAGVRPRLFRRMIKRGRLRADFRSLSALVWAAWASAHPASLRSFLLTLLRIRNRLALRHISRREPLAWRPSQPPQRVDLPATAAQLEQSSSTA